MNDFRAITMPQREGIATYERSCSPASAPDAGTIFVSHGRERVEGLTTAATIWLTAALGIAVGLERFFLAAGCTAIVFVVLRVVRQLPFEGDQQARS